MESLGLDSGMIYTTGAPMIDIYNIDCCNLSPRHSNGQSTLSSSSASEAATLADFMPSVPHGMVGLAAAEGSYSMDRMGDLHRQYQSAGAELRQQCTWPQLGQLTLQDLETSEDCLQDALDMFCPSPYGTSLPTEQEQRQHAACHEPAAAAAAQPCCSSPSTKKRKVGRPRGADIYPLLEHAAEVEGRQAWGDDSQEEDDQGHLTALEHAPAAKRGRGPKPKYVYHSQEEAADARRERNRKAALESYYKKRQRIEELEGQMEKLRGENEALEVLLSQVESGEAVLASPTDEGIDAWLENNRR